MRIYKKDIIEYLQNHIGEEMDTVELVNEKDTTPDTPIIPDTPSVSGKTNVTVRKVDEEGCP